MTPRGIRNNNPLNIELGDPWQGLAAQQTDGRFAQFQAPEYGFRAAAKVLNTYQNKHGLTTPRQMISRWAPAGENNVEAYVNSVAKRSGLDPDTPVNLSRDGFRLIEAMALHENGVQPFDQATIQRGIEMAGISGGQGGQLLGAESNDILQAAKAELARREQLDAAKVELARRQGGNSTPQNSDAINPSNTNVPAGMVYVPGEDGRAGRYIDTKAEAEVMDRENPVSEHMWGLAGQVVKGIPFAGEYHDEAAGWIDEKLGGVPGLKQERIRALNEKFERDHPSQSFAANLAGGMAAAAPLAIGLAPSMAARAPMSMAGKMALGAGAGFVGGGVEGAISGYGEGTDDVSRRENAIRRGLGGATFGTIFGGAAPAVAKGAENLIGYIRNRPDARTAADLGVSQEAADVVGRMVTNDGTGAAIRNIRDAGDDAMIADAGPATAGLLDATIQMAGPSGRVARDAINDRTSSASREINSALNEFLGKPRGMKEEGRNIAKRSAAIRQRAYDKAYSTPIDYSTPQGRNVESVLSRIPPRQMQEAITEANEELYSLGMKEQQIMAQIADDGSVKFVEMPTVRQLDYLKQALDKAGAEEDIFGRPTKAALRPRRIARELRGVLGKAVPAYDRAVALGGQKIAEDKALETGARILNGNFTREDVADALENASAAELRMARVGLRRQIDEVMANVKRTIGNPNVDAREGAKAMVELSSEAVRTKITTVMGEKESRKLLDRIDRAAKAFELQARTADNSKTFARGEFKGMMQDTLEPGAIGKLLEGSPVAASRSIVQSMTRMDPKSRREVEERIAGEIATLLTQRRGARAQAGAKALIKSLERAPETESLARRIGQLTGAGALTLGYSGATAVVN